MKNTKRTLFYYLPLTAWVVYLFWWLGINFFETAGSDNFADSYYIVALGGSFAGLAAASKWGLFKSRFGASIGYFSLGLFLQFIGFLIYTLYFRIGGVELAFPNIGDAAFLAGSLAYVLGVFNLLKVIVYKSSVFKPTTILATSIVSTLGLFWLLWVSFLHLGVNDERGWIYSFLNIAYPVIQSVYFLFGIVAVMQAKRITGGKMLLPVSVMLFALVTLYAADFSFLYLNYLDKWEPAGWNDLLYLTGFGMMTLSLWLIDHTRRAVSNVAENTTPEGDV